MNNLTKLTLALLGVTLIILPTTSDARAPVSRRTSKDFRELIVKGERPEIAACMVAAMSYVRTDAKFDAIKWNDEDSETAILRETEQGGHLARDVRFNAQLRSRQSAFFETWVRSEITCEQRDEGTPEVRVSAFSR